MSSIAPDSVQKTNHSHDRFGWLNLMIRKMNPAKANSVGKWIWILIALASVYFFLFQPMNRFMLQGSTDDWRYFHFHWEVSWNTIGEYGQFPFWNPYHCGGNVHLANAQSQFLSPLAWPSLLVGVPAGLKLFMLFHFLIGVWGGWLLGRQLGLKGWHAMVPAILFPCSGYFAYHMGGGHSSFLPFMFMPLILAFYLRSIDDIRYTAAVGGLLGLTVLEGGVYPGPFIVLLLGVVALLKTFSGGRFSLRPLTRLALAGVLAIALSALKLLPLLDYMRENQRLVPSDDSLSIKEVFQVFLSRRLERRFPGHLYVWPEYGAYVGIPLFAVALVTALVTLRKHWKLLLVMLLFTGLMMGNHGPWSPWELVRHLPVYKSLHVPSRFAVVVVLFLAIFAGFGLQAVSRFLQERNWKNQALKYGALALPVLFFLASVGDVISFSQHQFVRFTDRPIVGVREDAPFKMTRGRWALAHSYPRFHQGTVACYEGNPVNQGKVKHGLKSEAWLVPVVGGDMGAGVDTSRERRSVGVGSAQVAVWTPNQVEVDFRLKGTEGKPGEVLLVMNMNDHRHWRVELLEPARKSDIETGARPDPGQITVEKTEHDGLVAARLVGNDGAWGRVRFTYFPQWFILGVVLTILGLLGLVAVWFLGNKSIYKRASLAVGSAGRAVTGPSAETAPDIRKIEELPTDIDTGSGAGVGVGMEAGAGAGTIG